MLLRAFVGECDWMQDWEIHRITNKAVFHSDGREQVIVLKTSLVADKISAYCEFITDFEKYTVWNRTVGSLKIMMLLMMLINCDLTKQNYQEKATHLPDKIKNCVSQWLLWEIQIPFVAVFQFIQERAWNAQPNTLKRNYFTLLYAVLLALLLSEHKLVSR